MMYCTGGIRCEFFSPLLKKRGFKKVYQLDGGVIGYGLRNSSNYWTGKLFVFDDRLAIPINKENTDVISTCSTCEILSDVYYNCAYMDCNKLFLSCQECALKRKGCCCVKCSTEGRVRKMDSIKDERPTPFRKCSFDEKVKLSSKSD